MNAEWLSDARKIPDEVMNYLRRIAVSAVEEKHFSPETIAHVFGISRSSIYDWLRWYREQGEEALDSRSAPGASPIITAEMDKWLRGTVLNSTPVDHGYDTLLWTCPILVELLNRHHGIYITPASVAFHLHRLGLSCQAPCYKSRDQDAAQVDAFLDKEFPEIQKVAQEMGADIGFEDEAGVGVRTRAGRTWGEVGHPPQVVVSDRREGCNVLSIVTAEGELQYSLEDKHINGKRYIEFLQQIMDERERPLIVIADRASFHTSAEVQKFVRENCQRIRMYFFPPYSPELNPDEQVWNEIKHRQIGRQPVKNKTDLKRRLYMALKKLKQRTDKVRSFFQLPNTKYAALPKTL